MQSSPTVVLEPHHPRASLRGPVVRLVRLHRPVRRKWVHGAWSRGRRSVVSFLLVRLRGEPTRRLGMESGCFAGFRSLPIVRSLPHRSPHRVIHLRSRERVKLMEGHWECYRLSIRSTSLHLRCCRMTSMEHVSWTCLLATGRGCAQNRILCVFI